MFTVHATLIRWTFAIVAIATLGASPGGWALAPAVAQTQGVTVTGRATDGQGNGLGGATLVFSGLQTYTTRTQSDGTYSVVVLPGVYTVRATRLGYNSAEQSTYVVLPGGSPRLDVTLVEQTVSSLRTIASVRVNASNSSFNPTPASITIIPGVTFAEQGALSLPRVLEETPGFTNAYPIAGGNNSGRTAYAVSMIRDGFTTETSTLLDGHPVGNGDNGSTIISFFESYVFGNVELIKGPGATAPDINNAVNGTVNFVTLNPTTQPLGSVTYGVDGYGGQFSNFRLTGTTLRGKLSYALDYVIDGTPGGLNYFQMPSTLPGTALINGQPQTAAGFAPPANAATNGIQNNTLWATSKLLTCCYTVSNQFLNRNELIKLRWNFSPNTAFTASLLDDQLSAQGNGNVNVAYPVLFTPGATYTGPAGTPFQTGQAINTVEQLGAGTEAPGVILNRVQPIYQAEFRTGNANNTFIGRYYQSIFNFFITQGTGTWMPDQPWNTNLQLYGTTSLCPAGTTFVAATGKCSNGTTPVATTYTGQSVPLTFIASNGVCRASNGTFTAAPNSTGQACGSAANPFVAYAAPTFSAAGQFDKLYGETAEWDHSFPNSDILTISYDKTHHEGNLTGVSGPPVPPGVPVGAFLENQSILVRGQLNFNKLSATIANYFDTYREHYSTNGAIIVPGGTFSIANPAPTFQDTTTSRYDPRLGLTYRPDPNLSLRFSAGASVVPVYLSAINVSNTAPVLSAVTGTYSNSLANGGLVPETAFGYDAGFDWRLGDGRTIVSSDLYLENLRNQIFTTTTINCYTAATNAITPSVNNACTAPAVILYTTQNTNFGLSRYQGFELSVKRDQPVGLGFTVQGALMRGFPYAISPCFYYTAPNATCTGVATTNLGILPNINFQPLGSVGSPGAVAAPAPGGDIGAGFPYSQGYAEVHWRSPRGGFLQVTSTYFGNNNSFGVPAFLLYNANAQFPLRDRSTILQLNLFNAGNIWNQKLPQVYQGVSFPLANGKIGLTNANPLGPRRLTFSITHNFNF